MLTPKAGDCCVYCWYGDKRCPPVGRIRTGHVRRFVSATLASMHRAIRIGFLTAVIYAVNAYLSFVC